MSRTRPPGTLEHGRDIVETKLKELVQSWESDRRHCHRFTSYRL